ncbi:DUF3703 domain-containing protein [Streptomyces sp. NPDC048506]|uniref:DUF3703 domain-containing protein n=1 Tax=Streptomyces sp. NPDC048506 TaxID=3155028 RepID=UPI00344868D8
MAEHTYDEEMALGRQCLQDRDWPGAYRHFGKAHGLGHDVRSQHLAAHRGMLTAGWKAHSPTRVALQLFLWTAAFLFERGTSTALPRSS